MKLMPSTGGDDDFSFFAVLIFVTIMGALGFFAMRLTNRQKEMIDEGADRGVLYAVVRKRRARKQLGWKNTHPSKEELAELQ